MKKWPLLIVFLFFCTTIFSQKINYNIRGSITDTLNNPLPSATVLLLEKSDSTMISFGRTDLEGIFNFKNIEPGNHLVKVTYIGFIPLTVDASSKNGENVDLGNLEMVEIAQELMEVVIKAAKAPMKMKGDTIEYDASTFQVPEGSTVEDLLKRLPGIEVDQDGSILADGRDVTRVTVDGKSFFGSDPKAATKNLPAEGISKVQVFDRKSEEEEITGVIGESEEKEMNLELKEDFKSGGFGKIIAGAGNISRAELKGNYNKFNDKMQFALVGVGNNTGRNGLSWNDYQDFMGSGAFNFDDGGDYGFGGGGGRTIVFRSGGEDDIESSIQSIFFSGNNQGGFPENYNGGVNYNYDHNKNKLSAVYYYNQAGLERESFSETENFFPNFSISNNNVNENNRVSRGHRAELEYEREIDSFHTIRIIGNFAAIANDNQTIGSTLLGRNNLLTTSSSINNTLRTTGYLANGRAILRKKFKKRGRRMGMNLYFLNTGLDRDGKQESNIDFYNESNEIDSIAMINQDTRNIANKTQFKANALFVEPLSKRFFWQSFYNYSNRFENGDRDVLDVDNENMILNEFLSRIYENTIQLNRIGTSLRYSYNGVNISLGTAYQAFDLKGEYDGKGAADIRGTVDRRYVNWIPNFSFGMAPTRNSYLKMDYNVSAQEPSISSLQAIVDNSNPLFISEGNPDLVPTIAHRGSLYFSINKPASSLRFSINGSYTYNVDQIIRDQTVDENLITYTTLVNYSGGQSYFGYTNLNFPIMKNKITGRISYSSNFNQSFSFVNTILNETNTLTHSPGIRLSIAPNENFSLYANANFSWSNISYNINEELDQQTINHRYSIELNAKTIAGVYINSSLNYRQFRNDLFGFSQDIPILNVSIYRQFLKDNKGELRLSMYDGFNQNLNVSQFASGNGITTSETPSLAQYFMLSFTYNMRGIKSDTRKSSWWH